MSGAARWSLMRNRADVGRTSSGIGRNLGRLNAFGKSAATTAATRVTRRAAVAAAAGSAGIDKIVLLGAVVTVVHFVAASTVRIRFVTVATGTNYVSGENEGCRRDRQGAFADDPDRVADAAETVAVVDRTATSGVVTTSGVASTGVPAAAVGHSGSRAAVDVIHDTSATGRTNTGHTTAIVTIGIARTSDHQRGRQQRKSEKDHTFHVDSLPLVQLKSRPIRDWGG